MCRQCASRDVHDERRQLTCYLVHVGNHQQQTLRSCERGGECSNLKRPMYGTCCSAFRLHLRNLGNYTPQICPTATGPFVTHFCHWRTWCYWEYRDRFAKPKC